MEPGGLSLREAQTLPLPALLERALGATGTLYAEVLRPDPAITRGRAFDLYFASTPRSAGYPGLCTADTIAIAFGPAGNLPITTPAHVQTVYRGTVYRIVGDTAPRPGGFSDSDNRALAAQCAGAGPVLARRNMAAPRFFTAGSRNGGTSWAAHAYFGARTLAKASTGALPPAACEADWSEPADGLCDDQSALLRNLPMDRFLGLDIERCDPDARELCVTATFTRHARIDLSTIRVRIWTNATEVNGARPFELRGIRIHAYTLIS
jgi:hypothetical protein